MTASVFISVYRQGGDAEDGRGMSGIRAHLLSEMFSMFARTSEIRSELMMLAAERFATPLAMVGAAATCGVAVESATNRAPRVQVEKERIASI